MQSEQNTTVRTVTTNSFIYRIFANIWAIGMIEKIQAKAAQPVARGVVLCGPQSQQAARPQELQSCSTSNMNTIFKSKLLLLSGVFLWI